ncbi:hypothetical protein [Saccharothrix xinjiangensis]|uniref:Uncharacterized protein n=1 Tax=Saccharothrix xinjiangensis TaxID=204798 RepID=A0ABV9YDY2_9PSEU
MQIAGHTVQARVERDSYLNQGFALAEALNDRTTWTSLTAEAPAAWWHDTPPPIPDTRAGTVLGPLAEQLLRRAATILASHRRITKRIPPHAHDAISALPAATHGVDAEVRINPDDISRARGLGGTLHVIERQDGGVIFTKAHRDDCSFITSTGTRDCDGNCRFPHCLDHDQTLDKAPLPGRTVHDTPNLGCTGPPRGCCASTASICHQGA